MKTCLKTLCLATSIFSLTSTSCAPPAENFEEASFPADYEQISLETAAFTDAAFELLMQVVDATVNTVGHSHREESPAPWLTGVEVYHDEESKVFEIDFGDDGSWPGGLQRSGKVRVHYNDLRYVYGSTYTVTLEKFVINHVALEGELGITFLSKATPAKRKYEVSVVDGKLTWPDGTFVTLESNHYRTVLLGSLAKHDEVTWEGASSGRNRHGYPYTSIITDPIRFRKTCLVVGNVFPSSGKAESTMKGASIVMDYGEESCDNLADITLNGRFFEAELSFYRGYRGEAGPEG